MPSRGTLGIVALTLLAAGCSSSSAGVRYIGAAPSASGSPSSAAPSPSPTGLVAENGTDVAACADGTCEIVVQGTADVPLDRGFGFTRFRVTFVPPDTVEFFGADPDRGNLSGYISGTGNLEANGIKVAVRMVEGQGAVLRFSPR